MSAASCLDIWCVVGGAAAPETSSEARGFCRAVARPAARRVKRIAKWEQDFTALHPDDPRIILQALCYGCGGLESSGFLFPPPKIPNILPRTPFFFSGCSSCCTLYDGAPEVTVVGAGLLDGAFPFAAAAGGVGSPFPNSRES